MKIYSLNIGVSITDKLHYKNSLIPLPCCTSDAIYMNSFSDVFGYDHSTLLLNKDATVENVKNEILQFSELAKSGDLVIITYSGHGSVIPDGNYDEHPRANDQTWCLYDRQIIDDEFRHLWKEFAEGVNILVIMDSCHSGTAYKSLFKKDDREEFAIDYSRKVKSIKSDAAYSIFLENMDLYEPICTRPFVRDEEIKCYVAGIAACQDDEEALAGTFISFFTRLIISTLASKFGDIENYQDFVELVSIQSKELENITPLISYLGNPTDFFSTTQPFLKINQEYPEGISSLYNDIVFGNSSITNKGLVDNGLIIEFLEKPSEELLKSINSLRLESISDSDQDIKIVTSSKLNKTVIHPWDKAYILYDELKQKGASVYVEADIEPFIEKSDQKRFSEKKRNDYLKNWPHPLGHNGIFTWHLDDDHSQLATACNEIRNSIPEEDQDIVIAQIDTGYNPNHPAIPLKVSKGISYVRGEEFNPAYDKPTPKWIEQEDHGTATLSILAGKKVSEELAYGNGSTEIGAIPFASIYPIRISDTVALTSILGNSEAFVKGIKKVIAEECEVVTMSMGGLPKRVWAKVINEAYEKGITIVTAAGNSWTKGFANIAPKKILYPARFDRVIAATGVCYNQYPYVAKANPYFNRNKAEGGEFMQGNYYPKSAMKTALAAYTPNVPWAIFEKKDKKTPIILKSGAGTSSATPQIAAAAALWIIKNRKELIERGYHGNWKQVEAVKYALFGGAKKNNIVGWEKYYGKGILKAMNTLKIPVPDESELKKAPKARVSFELAEFIKLIILRKSSGLKKEQYDSAKAQMIFQEIVQVTEQDPKLVELYQDIDFIELAVNNELTEEMFKEVCKQVALSPYSSEYLKSLIYE